MAARSVVVSGAAPAFAVRWSAPLVLVLALFWIAYFVLARTIRPSCHWPPGSTHSKQTLTIPSTLDTLILGMLVGVEQTLAPA